MVMAVCLVWIGMLGAPTRASAVATTGAITGTVTDAATLLPITGIDVTVVETGGSAGSSTHHVYTNSSGVYSIGGLSAGTYIVGFSDDDGDYLGDTYSDSALPHTLSDVVVRAGETTSNINAALIRACHVTGTVTDAATHGPVGRYAVDVAAYQSDGVGGWDYVNDVGTNSDGTYDVLVAAGTYRVEFDDESGTYVTQYYDDKPTM
jgi:5-hydroxyisourate hydrolase-like protein (transthyretin family)